MNAPVTEGGCYCGEIRYRATAEPRFVSICYCANCRRAAGAQSVAWVTFPLASFTFVKGDPVRYRTDTGAWRTFCSACGTSLTYENDKRPEEIDITTGSVDDPEAFAPREHIFEDEKLSWDRGPVKEENES